MINYRLATREDNEQLLKLTAASGMMGETGLRIDRKPNFFELLNMRGESKVFVALDGETIIGCLCVSFQQAYVDGQVFPIYYIGDFKVAETYRNKGIGLRLSMNMEDYLLSIGADLAFLNVSKGNNKPVSFFKNRPHVPDFDNIGIFKVHQFIGKKKKAAHANYKIELTPLTKEVLAFLNGHYKKYQIGSVITEEILKGSSTFIIRRQQDIAAAMCITDTMHAKQNVVTHLSWRMKYLLTFFNTFSRITGISRMPLLNEPVRMMYIKYLAVNKDEGELVRLLTNHARNIAYEKGYSFASIGLHEKDPLNDCFSKLLKLTFNSVGMLLSMKDNRALVNKIKQGVPFEDYSLV